MRVVVTGMGINTPLGDELEAYYEGLVGGRSAISNWKFFEHPGVYSKVGGDLSTYDAAGKLASFESRVPPEVHARLRKLFRTAPFSTRLSVLCSLDAWLDAGLGFDEDPWRRAVVLAGHNLNENYLMKNFETFQEEPDWIDPLAAVSMLDTDHASSIGETLGCRGALYTVGGACASANIALRSAVDEIRYHGHDVAMVTGAALDFSPMGLQAMALLGAITFESFHDEPARASRPYDTAREGFVPSHGAGSLVLESLDHARARGARIHAEILACEAASDASHLPAPSQEGQEHTIRKVLDHGGIAPEQVDFVSAHATSTPLGDISELRAIKSVFGEHTDSLKINAPKSMLGHTCWAAPATEAIAAILQMKHGRLHPSINVDDLDPEVDVDICANQAVDHEVRIILKNSFGFGGINCCALFGRWDG